MLSHSKTSLLMSFILTLSFSLQSLAVPNEIKERNKQIVAQMKSMKIEDMNLNDLEIGIQELRKNLDTLKEDLELAEIRADNRLAIKVRNGIGLTTAALIILGVALVFRKQSDGSELLLTVIFGPMGIAATGAAQGYIYLTSGELHSLQSTISKVEQKIAKIDQKIQKRKAGH